MPLYEYVCQSCEHEFEIVRRFDDPPVSHCVRCGGQVRRKYGTFRFRFRSRDWHPYTAERATGGEAVEEFRVDQDGRTVEAR